jgi:glucosamine kinase
MRDEQLLVGIDGGGTKCRARISDLDGNILGEGQGGPANTRLGLDVAFGSIIAAVDIALASAGLDLGRKKNIHAGLGLAGLSLKREQDIVASYDHPFASMRVESDAHIACLGAHNGTDGAILILGTGSCGCALLGGKEHTVGGWGFEISDHGSGAHIGYEAVRASLLAYENVIPQTELSHRVMQALGNTPETAVPWAEDATPGKYGSFAPLVSELAEKGDPLAERIMRKSGADTALLLKAMETKGAGCVALIGGVASVIDHWLPEDVKHLLVQPEGDALDGALLLARRKLEAGK